MSPELILGRTPTEALAALTEREASLESELAAVQREMRRLRTAADLCPDCGGSGRRRVRGGLYGEVQHVVCHCALSGASAEDLE